MWFDESVFYQIYPLGFVGAPDVNSGEEGEVHRILKVIDWIPHLKSLNVNAVYFSPVFESDAHGYDTRDYTKIDRRLGTNEDFAKVCSNLHDAGIKVVLDGVFNHVGRGFWAFEDVRRNRENSRYKDWFHINFGGNSGYNDGFWYEGWEGHFELVKLNLRNGEVVNHIFSCIKRWVEEFDIDGLRLDVAYCLDHDFMKSLRHFTDGLKDEFFLLGEMIHGDYNRIVNGEMLHSATNYELYKGIYSGLNSMNMFEIGHSVARQFGPEQWTLYKGMHLLTFVDNHDVTRIASILTNESHIKLAFALAFSVPGIPCIYYGSEWGITGEKKDGDGALRPCIDVMDENDLSLFISKLANAHRNSKALCYGDYKMLVLTNKQYIFERSFEGERVIVAINADSSEYDAHFDAQAGCAVDMISGEPHDFGGGSKLQPYSAAFWKI